ncbi:MAG: hypothetical protein HY760_03520 [Nitrospirae bacterium]|nr:hypothetical protein [Nitrospirota bacterium]
MENAGEDERALYFFKKGLEIDPASKARCQDLMNCYLRLGQAAEAAAVYRRFKKSLRENLGLNPSAKTEAIYRAISIA